MKRSLNPIPSLRRSLPLLACASLLAACAERLPLKSDELAERVRAEIAAQNGARVAAAATAPAEAAPEVRPVRPETPPEARFDLIVSGANARDVFLSMVSDTHYSMLMHPDVNGTMSVTLRSVTVREALESIRDVYGYDFRIEGRRITVYPPTLQTRIFTINYFTSQRVGRSEMRVSSGSTAMANVNGSGAAGGSTGGTGTGTAAPTTSPSDASQITTTSTSDFWAETSAALQMMLGKGEGRAVITSPQAGTIAVRAMPDELRQVELFLRASRVAIERQVMLEAKIVEVELRDGYQSGIDWSLLHNHDAIGQTSGNATNALVTNSKGLPTLPGVVTALFQDTIGVPPTAGAVAGLSLAARGFQAVLGFLETHGDLQILSSPRIATLNNQKAVLKVGSDDFFVTGITGGSVTPALAGQPATTTLPTITLTPFFSGIALDVTPQIDEGNMITLHLKPSVTAVTEKIKQVNLGTIGNYLLPVASSNVNETDTVVRVPDGQIVAIGGLMQVESNRTRSGLPGSGENAVTRNLMGNNSNTGRKRELVVLIKPTIIRNSDDWQRSTEQSLAAMDQAPQRTVVVNAAVAAPAGAPLAAVVVPSAPH